VTAFRQSSAIPLSWIDKVVMCVTLLLDEHRVRFQKTNSMTARTKLRFFLALLITYASVSSGQIEPSRGTGIEGVITVSPTRPGPIRAGSDIPNAAPLPNAKFSVTSDETVVTTFTTDTNGRFQISLKPGHYSVLLTENRFPKPCGPFEIDIEQGKMTEVEWHCDSGMR
jgi:hypothetical protein